MTDLNNTAQNPDADMTGQSGSCLLLTLRNGNMLVPRNIVAEVVRHSFVDFSENEEIGLRYFDWRGCKVPYVTNELIGEFPEEEIDDDTRVVIFYGLKDNRKLPFYGFTVARSPQLLQVTDEELQEVSTETSLHPGALMQVSCKDSEAFIPKVDYFENSVLKLIN